MDEPVETRLERAIDRPIFARPAAEALLQPQRVQSARAKEAQAEIAASLRDEIKERTLIVDPDPDLVPEIAGVGDAPDLGGDHPELHLAEGQERKGRGRDIVMREALQQLARARTR